jgi:uncharacterized repeat protein (TIGR01451 family)
MRILPALSLLLLASRAFALEVVLYEPISSACGYPTGVLQALISGGVPPYTVLWSTGATTEIITGLGPGTYSVTVTDFVGTQASAQTEMVAQFTNQAGGQTFANLTHCPGAYPMVELTLFNEAQWGVPVWGPSPHLITGPPEVMSVATVPCMNCADMDSLVRVELNVPPGSLQTITWTDANGCPGSSTVFVSEEVLWPAVQVYNVQGSCGGGNNGSFAYTVTDPYLQNTTLRILRPNGTLLSSVYMSSGASGAHGQLAPGTYTLVVLTEYLGPFGDETCGDTTLVVIDDLGGTCANVNGTIFIDGNANCAWAPGENRLPNAIVEFTPGPFYATADIQGQYSTNLPLGTYDHAVIYPNTQQECFGPVVLDGSQSAVVEPIGNSSLVALDAEVTMANGPARPGFSMLYAMNVRNYSPANAGPSTLTLELDPNLTFVSGLPAPIVNGNTLTWNFIGIGAYANRLFKAYVQVPPDVSLVGTTLTCTAGVTTTNTDAVPANNTWVSQQVVTASYDPNDKTARTSTGWSDQLYLIDQDAWIDYTIRFQNTGTDTAFMVVITDTLPATLDPASLQVGAASHAFNWNLSGPGIITFNFPGILLPDSNVNEPRSHGFVGFRIRPRLPIAPGTTIENIANIYFDFNPPIITEPSVLVAELSTGVGEERTAGLSVWPIPTSDLLQLNATTVMRSVRILSLDGSEVAWHPVNASSTSLDLSPLHSGTYLLITELVDGSQAHQRITKL